MTLFQLTRPAALLRIEGAFALGLATFFFWRSDGNWALYALLLLAPDIGMLGYVRGSRVGSAAYNLFHTYAMPAALGTLGTVTNTTLLVWLALIWGAHIGMDRLIGYGLKYPWAPFKETHLDKV